MAANIQLQLVNVVVGHCSGMDDRYVTRNPKIVKPCTEAVYRADFKREQSHKTNDAA